MSPFTRRAPRQHPYYSQLLHHLGLTAPDCVGVVSDEDPDGCRVIKVIFPAPTDPEERDEA